MEHLFNGTQGLDVGLACVRDAIIQLVVLLHAQAALLHLALAGGAEIWLCQVLLEALEDAALACMAQGRCLSAPLTKIGR